MLQASHFPFAGSYPGAAGKPHVAAKSVVSRAKRVSTEDGEPAVYAIDHMSTKLKIPLGAIQPTAALSEDGVVPGLCRLHLAGRCRQGLRCRQVHALCSVVEQLRAQAYAAPSCCAFHGARCSYDGLPLGLTMAIGHRAPQPLRGHWQRSDVEDVDVARLNGSIVASNEDHKSSCSDINSPGYRDEGSSEEGTTEKKVVATLHSLLPTSYLHQCHLEHGDTHLKTTADKICRDHAKGLCKFGEECGFLHVCRELSAGFDLSHVPTATSERRRIARGVDAGAGLRMSASKQSHADGRNGSFLESEQPYLQGSSSFTAAAAYPHGSTPQSLADHHIGSYPITSNSLPVTANAYHGHESPSAFASGSVGSINRGNAFGSFRQVDNSSFCSLSHSKSLNPRREAGGEVVLGRTPLLRPLLSSKLSPSNSAGRFTSHNPYAESPSFS